MVYNTISTKQVIAKILRDLDIQEDNLRISDIREWIGEGLRRIGAVKMLNVKVTGKEDLPLLTLSNYQCKLPEDLFYLLGVAYCPTENGTFIPLRYGTGIFDSRGGDANITATSTDPADSLVIQQAMYLYDLTYAEALELINTDPITTAKIKTTLIDNNSPTLQDQGNITMDYTYVINSSYIKTNIDKGYLMMAYAALSVDEEGYPLIPDNEMFTEALYWYVFVKLMYPKWLAGELRDRIYDDARRSWNFYRKAAYAEAMLPNIDQLESLKNKALQLYPEINEHQNFFSTTGEQQIIHSHNYFKGTYSGRLR